MKRRMAFIRRYGVVCTLLVVALLADVLANDVPVLARRGGRWSSPVVAAWGHRMRPNDANPIRRKAVEDYDWALWPLMAYAPSQTDYGAGMLPPLARGERGRHWLGTDAQGRDVAAGLVWGTRTALWIGGVAMGIAGLLGVLLGGIAGYFGNGRLRLSAWGALVGSVLLVGVAWLGYYGWWDGLSANGGWRGFSVWVLAVCGAVVVWGLERWRPVRWGIPADGAVQRLVEVLNAIPALIVLLALVAVLEEVSAWTTALVIGLVTWPRVARLVRADMLRIRELPYVLAARVSGWNEWRIWWRYALPNALSGALVTLAFGMGSAVLLEATLSFLGLSGVPPMESWGGMLQLARERSGAWWLAVFPGWMIFVTVRSFSRLGEGREGGGGRPFAERQ